MFFFSWTMNTDESASRQNGEITSGQGEAMKKMELSSGQGHCEGAAVGRSPDGLSIEQEKGPLQIGGSRGGDKKEAVQTNFPHRGGASHTKRGRDAPFSVCDSCHTQHTPSPPTPSPPTFPLSRAVGHLKSPLGHAQRWVSATSILHDLLVRFACSTLHCSRWRIR